MKVKITYTIEPNERRLIFYTLKEHKMSLRTFSKQAGYSVAFVSEAFLGKKNFTPKLANACKEILDLDLIADLPKVE